MNDCIIVRGVADSYKLRGGALTYGSDGDVPRPSK